MTSPTPTPTAPLASVSLDVDNLWSYLKTHGDAAWETRPSYLPTFVPLVLDAFAEAGVTATCFLVGADCRNDEDAAALGALAAAGHDIGNHSFEHEPWLHRYPRAELEAEIANAEDAIAYATGRRPRGFRGPGFSWSPDLLDILARRGYLYDASTLPTFLGPLARAYYLSSTKLSPAERERRSHLFGSVQDGFRPLKPYRWALADDRSILEIPVTTMPGLRTPFHLSYLLFLARRSESLMWWYLRAALAACRLTGTEPSFLLHPLDILGGDDVPALRFFPGMDLPTARKRALFVHVLAALRARFTLLDLSAYARVVLARDGLAVHRPALAA